MAKLKICVSYGLHTFAAAPLHRLAKSYALRTLQLIGLFTLLISQPTMARVVSIASGNLLLDQTHGGGMAWGKKNCSACHQLGLIHRQAPKIKPIAEKKGYGSCTGCHGGNGTRAERQCLTCHNSKDLPLKPWRGGRHRHDFVSGKDLKTTSKQCLICHENSDMNGRFELDRDLTMLADDFIGRQPYNNISEFCIRCHNVGHQQKAWPIKNAKRRDQLQRAENDYLKIDAHGVRKGRGDGKYNGLRAGGYQYPDVVDCSDCHTLHGTKNPNLIIEDSRQGERLLDPSIRGDKSHAYKVEVDKVGPQIEAGNYGDLCVLCHSMTTISDGGDEPMHNGLSGVHTDLGKNCLQCHSHGEAVQKGL